MHAHGAGRILHGSLAPAVRIRNAAERRVEPVVYGDDRIVVLVEQLANALELGRQSLALCPNESWSGGEHQPGTPDNRASESAERHGSLQLGKDLIRTERMASNAYGSR